jgi:hypothetical protein
MDTNLKGTIFIVDISGYSHFVNETENEMGSLIIAKLLNAIIKANNLSFLISEIEGDAILFYQHGPAFPIDVILAQFEAMLRSFNNEVGLCKSFYPQVEGLSIKLVVHYGDIGNFSVSGFSKLYGPTVVEAHRLLKNNIGSHTYVLITDEYRNQQNQLDWSRFGTANQVCELYDIGKLCYSYFNYPTKAVNF